MKIAIFSFMCSIMFSCGNGMSFNENKISEIKLKSVETGEEITINDKNVISVLFNDYVNNNESYIAKFKGINHITFTYKGKEVLLITNGTFIKYEGKTFKLKKDIDEFIKTLTLHPFF